MSLPAFAFAAAEKILKSVVRALRRNPAGVAVAAGERELDEECAAIADEVAQPVSHRFINNLRAGDVQKFESAEVVARQHNFGGSAAANVGGIGGTPGAAVVAVRTGNVRIACCAVPPWRIRHFLKPHDHFRFAMIEKRDFRAFDGCLRNVFCMFSKNSGDFVADTAKFCRVSVYLPHTVVVGFGADAFGAVLPESKRVGPSGDRPPDKAAQNARVGRFPPVPASFGIEFMTPP